MHLYGNVSLRFFNRSGFILKHKYENLMLEYNIHHEHGSYFLNPTWAPHCGQNCLRS